MKKRKSKFTNLIIDINDISCRYSFSVDKRDYTIKNQYDGFYEFFYLVLLGEIYSSENDNRLPKGHNVIINLSSENDYGENRCIGHSMRDCKKDLLEINIDIPQRTFDNLVAVLTTGKFIKYICIKITRLSYNRASVYDIYIPNEEHSEKVKEKPYSGKIL